MTPLLEIEEVHRLYASGGGMWRRAEVVRAVAGVTLRLAAGETLGIVGESGSGKSTLGRLALGLERPDSGHVRFDGAPMPAPGTAAWRSLRRRAQMIFQDPLGALDRRLPVVEQVAEPLVIHGPAAAALDRARDMLTQVGLSADQALRYPHELSGGQRQRVVIARALMTEPDLLVCDEPVSALDVSIQAQVVNLLADLQAARGLAMIFISHDLRVVRQVSTRVAIVYLGQIVEEGPAAALMADPQHPYARALVSAAPVPRAGLAGRTRRIILQGEPPNPAARPPGCAFHPRCPVAIDRCRTEMPALTAIARDRRAACHLLGSGGSARQMLNEALMGRKVA